MENVKCIECGSNGYTASPEAAKCEKCKGDLEIDYGEYVFRGGDYCYFTKVLTNVRRMHAKCSGGV